MSTVNQTFEALRRALGDYIEAAYHISDPTIVKQRAALLDQPGTIFQSPFIESTPRYKSGRTFAEMHEIPAAARNAFLEFSKPGATGKPLLFNPPYTHQEQAITGILAEDKNLMIMTGTGSGKTESFLLPILGKLAVEATEHPKQFSEYQAVRAMILYPMNALVNDQLGRLRLLFGDERVSQYFSDRSGRPARFARYTSRTPYAGVRTRKKDDKNLAAFGDFFVRLQNAANEDGNAAASKLMSVLKAKGRWPAKHNISDWYGADHSPWQDKNGDWQRAILGDHDVELITRHEAQLSPPDLLITNYSMLEYMMMRPIEQPIFDKTKQWLKDNPDEKMLIVLDEAHLYRGAQGAEVGLLLRRLRNRLGIPTERFQVICATASFNEDGEKKPADFGSELTGVPSASFLSITGDLALRTPAEIGTIEDANALSQIDIEEFYSDGDGHASIASFLKYRSVQPTDNLQRTLHKALKGYPPLNFLVNITMVQAVTVQELAKQIFPNTPVNEGLKAVSHLLVIGSAAREAEGGASLLPARLHTFFRGLPGLWACMDPDCSEISSEHDSPVGKLYAQPRQSCGCGAPVLEYYTCRYCGTSYARAYTNNLDERTYLWGQSGVRITTEDQVIEAFQPLDLLLQEPNDPSKGFAANYDIATGRLDPKTLSDKVRRVYINPSIESFDEEDEVGQRSGDSRGQFVSCGCCGQRGPYNSSSVQDHLTKGDQPFQALLSTQIRVQPPSLRPATRFAPMRGRKSLIFSDSRQVAARLAPRLQSYSLRDAVRALLPAGAKRLSNDPDWKDIFHLDLCFLAVMLESHMSQVRVRPSLNPNEILPYFQVELGEYPSQSELIQFMSKKCPENLLEDIVTTIVDRNYGLEPLAIASLKDSTAAKINTDNFPTLPELASSSDEKHEILCAWLRCWREPGIRFGTMPPSWTGTKIKHHKGQFQKFTRYVLVNKDARRVFKKDWLPELLNKFTVKSADGGRYISADKLSFAFDGEWQRCGSCTSVHRPVTTIKRCLDCGSENVQLFDPDADMVFQARKGFYRDPVVQVINGDTSIVSSLIAAEHTAQLNSADSDSAFSKAEIHELRFQDIDTSWEDEMSDDTAVDILSSTTTMEVGIDIGELSGVALRNMPPARSNYQQRAGRAGRRGTSIASVLAFGSADSHDEHYFSNPESMIRGVVTDPSLALDNPDIAQRHVRAYLLQRYHEQRLNESEGGVNATLFSVLGSVADFKNSTGVLNREDLEYWLNENENELQKAILDWLPEQLPKVKRDTLIAGIKSDLLGAIDQAINYVAGEEAPTESVDLEVEEETPFDFDPDYENKEDQVADEAPSIQDEEIDFGSDKLLERLLYHGVLPRYAFPTDVATFHIFNKSKSNKYRPVMAYAPQQGLNIALSQYAPNKQLWVDGSQYISKAIYSPHKDERSRSWARKKLYFECMNCGYARTEEFTKERQGLTEDCEVCTHTESFGPGRQWFRPVGFAHPVKLPPVTSQESQLDTARATRAKLDKPSPGPNEGWVNVGTRIRAFRERTHLLVSNTGPGGDGYNYCSSCGRIEAKKSGHEGEDTREDLFSPHSFPYPADESENCPGGFVASGVVLGTEFPTDLALFSLPIDEPFRLRPGTDETRMSLRTLSEAMSKAASLILEMEPGEVVAEFRPALSPKGAQGREVEIFIYDTLSGGAGFSPQLVDRAGELFERTREVLGECPSSCDSSCYRCLNSFRNKFEHAQLDRFLGLQLLEHAFTGQVPDYAPDRSQMSIHKLFSELVRQSSDRYDFALNKRVEANDGVAIHIPIIATNRNTNRKTYVTLASPIAPTIPYVAEQRIAQEQGKIQFITINDMLVRFHTAAAVRTTLGQLA